MPAFPTQNLVPCTLVEPIMYLDHSLDVLLWRLPTFTRERIVELLWGGILPGWRPTFLRCAAVVTVRGTMSVGIAARYRGRGAGSGERGLLGRTGRLRELRHLVEWVEPASGVIHGTLGCGGRRSRRRVV
jgi:hypothetical protein